METFKGKFLPSMMGTFDFRVFSYFDIFKGIFCPKKSWHMNFQF